MIYVEKWNNGRKYKRMNIHIAADEDEKDQIMKDLESLHETNRYEIYITFEQSQWINPVLTV